MTTHMPTYILSDRWFAVLIAGLFFAIYSKAFFLIFILITMVILRAITVYFISSKDILNGIKKKEFHLVYQPIFNAKDNTLSGAEALLRWTHPLHGEVSPLTFIPIAERSGIIIKLTQHVFSLLENDLDVNTTNSYLLNYVNVNISPAHLSTNIFEHSKKLFHLNTTINFEITERQLLDITPMVESQMLLITKQSSSGFVIDDFGAGYSSFDSLLTSGITSIKIDKKLIDKISTHENAILLIQWLVDLAAELNISVVAEGVEDTSQRDELIKVGVVMQQGFLFSHPLPISKLNQHYKQIQRTPIHQRIVHAN